MKNLVFLAVPLIAIGTYLYIQTGITNEERREITAEIVLVNECDVPSAYFAVKKLESGRTYSLAKGQASIDAIKGEKLQLVLSPKYKDVEYDGMIFKASEFQRVTADCSFGERQRGVTDGLKNTFSGGG
ncbi:hypothetical protein AB8880_03720 [Alphaproteobacteria bacterium LSUCC0684]